MTRSPDDLPPALPLAVAHGEARLPRRAAAARRRVRDDACSPRCPTRCSRCGSSCSPTGFIDARPHARSCVAALGLARVGDGHLVPARRVRPRAAPLPRQDRGRARSRTSRTLQASVATIEHHERPEYLDRLAVLRDQVFALDHLFMSLFSTRRLDRPARPSRSCCSCPSARCSCSCRCSRSRSCSPRTWRPGVERAVEESVAPHDRLATPPVPARHDRARRQGGARRRASARSSSHERRDAWEQWYRPVAPRALDRPRCGTRSRGRCSAARYVGAIVFVAAGLDADVGDVCSSSPPAAGSRSTSAPRSASSASCAASGSTRRGGSPGSRTTPRRIGARRRPGGARPARPTASASSTCRSAYPGTDRARARRRRPRPAGRRGGRARRRERRRQDARS